MEWQVRKVEADGRSNTTMPYMNIGGSKLMNDIGGKKTKVKRQRVLNGLLGV